MSSNASRRPTARPAPAADASPSSTSTPTNIGPSTNPTCADQEVYIIRKADGSTVNVGISTKKAGTIGRLNSVKPGEIVGILFESETPPTTKGFAPAKNLKVMTYGVDPSYSSDAFDLI